MADCFIVRRGGKPDKFVQPLVLFEGTDDSYTLADGFTGFSLYSQGVADININKTVDATTESQYGYRIAKPWSINVRKLIIRTALLFHQMNLLT